MDIIVVDGYNIIGAWDELIRLKRVDIAHARKRLIELMQEYQAYMKNRIIIVFDALYVKGNEHRQTINGVEVIYTKEDETADECIERLVKIIKNVNNVVYVATSDFMEQRTIFSRGALRMSARELRLNIEEMNKNYTATIQQHYSQKQLTKIELTDDVKKKLEEIRRKGKR